MKITRKKILTISAIVIGFSICFISPQKTYAVVPLGVPTLDTMILDSSPTSISRTKDTLMQWLKSFTLDKLAYIAAKQVLHQMTVATITWINSGFHGSPAFLSHPGAFFLDAADQVTGNFLTRNGPLNGLCSPWNVDVRLALALGMAGNLGSDGYNRYSCTLSTVIGNAKNTSITVDGFVNGDFSQGGWPAFMELSTNPQGNAYGAYLSAHSELLSTIGLKQSSIGQDLLQGQGFLSWQDCPDYTTNSDGTTPSKEDAAWLSQASKDNCTTKTPGSVIAGTLMPQLNDPTVELQLANDINSIVGALITQMMGQLLNKGLSALSGSGSDTYTRGSYVNQLYAEAAGNQTVYVPTKIIDPSITNNQDSYTNQLYTQSSSDQTVDSPATTVQPSTTNDSQTTYSKAVSVITDSQNRYLTAQSCFSNKIKTLPSEKVALASSQMSAVSTALSTKVGPLLSELKTKLDSAEKQSNSTLPDTVTVQGSTDANTIQDNLQAQIKNYVTQVNTISDTSTSAANDLATANTDLSNAQQQANAFNADAANYQSTCDSLQYAIQ